MLALYKQVIALYKRMRDLGNGRIRSVIKVYRIKRGYLSPSQKQSIGVRIAHLLFTGAAHTASARRR